MENGALQFHRVVSEQPAVDFVLRQISERLAKGQSVLWLLSGGSAIKVAVGVAKKLESGVGEHNLTVSLVDERYGVVDHPDSNWRHLQEAGFTLPEATLHPVLTGASWEYTTAAYADWLKQAYVTAQFKIGLLGIGSDGHTSGILPESPAVDADAMAVAYEAPPFQRITTTGSALAALDMAVVYAAGKSKQPALAQLTQDVDPAQQPAQLLKRVPEVHIFNDQIGEIA